MTSAKKPDAFERHAHDEGLSPEERLQAARTWNAALAAVEEQMPKALLLPSPGPVAQAQARGWNFALSAMSERIAALRESGDG